MYIFVLVYFFNFIYHLTKPLNIAKYVLMTELTTTETCQKYSVTVIFYYIFHIKPQFLETLFQSQFCSILMKCLPTEARTYAVFVIILKYFLGAQVLNVHDLNTNLNYLSSNILSLYCILDVLNLVLYLNRELIKIIDYKFMIKLQCKTTFNSVFVGKKNHQNRTRVDFGIMFLKNVVLHEIYSKKSQ